MDSFPVLTTVTFLPAVTALIIALLPAGRDAVFKWCSLVAMLVVLVLSTIVFFQFDGGTGASLQFEENYSWISRFQIRYHMGVDGIAVAMVLLTALLSPLAAICSWRSVKTRVRGFFIVLLLLETGMMGVFCAADLFLFYVFWEVMLLPMALMIGIWGGPRRIYAAIKFVIYTMVGSLLMFVAILYCYVTVMQAGAPTFNIFELQSLLPTHLSADAQLWLFLAFALSFAIKVPMFPFHTWLPDAHVEAPTAGSVILAGVLLKMGAYGFLRFGIPFFPEAAVQCAFPLVVISVVGILYGSLMSMAQADIKKLIAYSSVAHLGFVTLGIFSGNLIAAQGSMLQMVNHGVSTGALFLLVGVIYDRLHRRGVMDFGGLAKVMPVYATLFLITALSSVGLPGLNGFVGEFLILNGTFQSYPLAGGVATFGIVLAAAYMLTMYRNVFFGEVTKEDCKDLPDVNGRELLTIVPLVALTVVLGVYPNIVLEKTEQSVAQVMEVFQEGPTEVVNADHNH